MISFFVDFEVNQNPEITGIQRYMVPNGAWASLPPKGGNSVKKPGIEIERYLFGYPYISMPGNLVTHRQCLRTRGSVQCSSFILLLIDG